MPVSVCLSAWLCIYRIIVYAITAQQTDKYCNPFANTKCLAMAYWHCVGLTVAMKLSESLQPLDPLRQFLGCSLSCASLSDLWGCQVLSVGALLSFELHNFKLIKQKSRWEMRVGSQHTMEIFSHFFFFFFLSYTLWF